MTTHNPTEVVIIPYSVHSKSANKLARALGARVLQSPCREYRVDSSKLVINWGRSTLPEHIYDSGFVLNKSSSVRTAVDKHKTLVALSPTTWGDDPFDRSFQVPDFTTDMNKAVNYLRDQSEPRVVFCRTTTTGRDGEGLVIARRPEEVVPAPLYTKGIMGHTQEYRVTVVLGKVVGFQMKVRINANSPYSLAKTSSNGYGFHWLDVRNCPQNVKLAAEQAAKRLDLDICGIDMIVLYQDSTSQYILEANTAPELTELATAAIVRRIRQVYPSLR